MKLTDLDPGWFTTDSQRTGMGLTFRCPCKVDCEQYLGVWFQNPIDGGQPAAPEILPAPRWHRVGETFETLTLTPSIDVSSSGHWHGFIKDGQIV